MNSRAVRSVANSRTTVLGAGLLIGLTLGLAGCSGSSSGAAPAAQTSAAAGSATPAATGSAAGSAKTPSSVTKAAKVTPIAICGVIQGLQPSLKAATAQDAARLTLQVQISNYFDSVHAQPRLTGAVIDKDLKKSCPAVRRAALKTTGKKSFADIL